MALTDFQIFNQFQQSAQTEVIDQQVQLWNAATNNTLMLSTAGNIGDFSEESSYSLIADLYGNRDPDSTADATAVALAQLLDVSVKVGQGSKPVSYTGTAFDWTRRDPREAGTVFGTQVGLAKMQYMVNTAIAAVSAAIGNNGLSLDRTADGTASLESLNLGAGQFGDRMGSISCWLMHSKSLTDIYGNALGNSNRLFEIGNVRVVQDGFGRPLVMTDSPALTFDNSGTQNYYQLGLVQGAVVVEDNADSRVYEQTEILKENAEMYIKEEASFNIGLRGYAWDKANGGAKPNDAALATGTNWDKYVTSDKDTAGVRVQTL